LSLAESLATSALYQTERSRSTPARGDGGKLPSVRVLGFPVRKLALIVVAVVAPLVAAGCGGGSGPSARPVAAAFLSAWSRGRYQAAGRLTTAPRSAAAALSSAASILNLRGAELRLKAIDEHGSTARATVSVALSVGGLGMWRFGNTVPLRKIHGRWRVAWSLAVVEPRLAVGRQLALVRQLPPREPVLDRNGQPLFSETPVVTIGVVPKLLRNRQQTLRMLEQAAGLDPANVRRLIAAAPVDAFVPLITLRRAAYEQIRAQVHPLPGVHFLSSSESLAPTRGFARPLLGFVGAATADALRAAGPHYTAADAVGLAGLQEVYQRRLAGTASGAVLLESRQGKRLANLFAVKGSRGRPVRVTLDRRMQAAAEAALDVTTKPAALVAVQASTGDLLAVANRPVDSYDRALSGLYPPGSSFKIATTAALLARGIDVASNVPCRPSIVVDGKPFKNFEGEAFGATSFAEDFARSCNTAFISLADRITQGQLAAAAHLLGIGRRWTLPVPSAGGQVPPTGDPVEHAADMIGQGRVLVSPLAMALAAGAIDSGSWHAPVLVTDPAGQRSGSTSAALPPGIDTTLRQLMRLVVTSGTGTAANLPGAPVYGKTGTAEYGTGTPPPTHAWFVGFRGDIAFAVIVEGGGIGGQAAAPIAAKFLKLSGSATSR
jgi:cell division protein FtsI/penicillin-binding protein 2